MHDGDSWWSTIAVVPDCSASTAPSIADHRIISASSAASSRHQICSSTSRNVVGCRGGAGMPRASVEYRWWWPQTRPGVTFDMCN